MFLMPFIEKSVLFYLIDFCLTIYYQYFIFLAARSVMRIVRPHLSFKMIDLFLIIIVSFLLIIFSSPPIFSQSEFTSEDIRQFVGTLKLDGQFIKLLELKEGGKVLKFEDPGREIKLPLGYYVVYRIILQDDASQFQAEGYLNQEIHINPFEPIPVLKAGAPLTSSILIERDNDVLRINYYLKDSYGNIYRLRKNYNENPPNISIYKNNKKIVSDKFYYG